MKVLIPFVISQLDIRGVPVTYTDQEAMKITALQDKLRQWNRDELRKAIDVSNEEEEEDIVEPPDEIEVLINPAIPEWTIDHLYDVIGNGKKRKRYRTGSWIFQILRVRTFFFIFSTSSPSTHQFRQILK